MLLLWLPFPNQHLIQGLKIRMSDQSKEPVVVIHGGAWAIPDKLSSASVDGVCSAARAGYDVLMRGGSAVDAVEAAVRVMEDCPAFDAGILQR